MSVVHTLPQPERRSGDLPVVRELAATAQEDVSLVQLWRATRRHILLIVFALLITVVPTVIYVVRTTPIYEADASIRIDEEKAQVPGMNLLSGFMGGGSDVSTEMAVLGSRTLAEDVGELVAVQVTLLQPARTPRDSLLADVRAPRDIAPGRYELRKEGNGRFLVRDLVAGTSRGTVAPGDEVAVNGARFLLRRSAAALSSIVIDIQPFDIAVDALQRTLTVDQPRRDANIVTLSFRHTDPAVATLVTNSLARRFIERRQDVQKTEARSTAAFLRIQLDTLAGQLANAERSLQRFREREQMVSPENEASGQIARLVQMQADRRGVDATRDAFSRLMSEIETQARSQRPGSPSPYRRLVAFPTLLGNRTAGDLLGALLNLENQRATLLTRLTRDDPDVQIMTQRIRDLEQQLHEVGSTYLTGLGNQVGSLDTALSAFGAELRRIPAKEVQFARLQREPKVLEEIYTQLQSRLKESEIAQAVQDPSVRVVDVARFPTAPVEPKPVLYLAAAIASGLLLGAMGTFIREKLDSSIHTTEDVRIAAGVSVIGYIPRIPDRIAGMGARTQRFLRAGMARSGRRAKSSLNGKMPRVAIPELEQGVLEAYSMMQTNIAFSRQDDPVRVVVFTSAMPGDGKTTSAINLSLTLTARGSKVLLVDADMRRGGINRVFGDSREPGLANILLGTASLEDSVRNVQVADGRTLHYLPTGPHASSPTGILSTPVTATLVERMRQEYDAVIFDSPPVNIVPDAAMLGRLADGVILVARVGVTENAALTYAMEQLNHGRVHVIGALLNDIDFRKEAAYDSAYQYYNYDAYASTVG
jgi:succinoglycan biosynthesis transport protein ExoP